MLPPFVPIVPCSPTQIQLQLGTELQSLRNARNPYPVSHACADGFPVQVRVRVMFKISSRHVAQLIQQLLGQNRQRLKK
jgi:hypothetical protein